jgi:hypothetical protein
VVVRASDGTPFYAPSVWRDANGVSAPAPPALALAAASGGAVVGPGGDPEDTGRAIKTAPPVQIRPIGDAGPGDTP